MKIKRSFTVTDIRKHGGCATKFNSGRFLSSTPMGAVKKAFNRHCRLKAIRGVCTLIIEIQETTQDSEKKKYLYELHRHKLDKPIVRFEGTPQEFKIQYSIQAKSIKSIPKLCKKPGKTPGPMKKHKGGLCLTKSCRQKKKDALEKPHATRHRAVNESGIRLKCMKDCEKDTSILKCIDECTKDGVNKRNKLLKTHNQKSL